MLSDDDIYTIVRAEESQAIGFMGADSDISQNRKTLMEHYNQEPFGDEIEGQSQVVTSDVYDTVEGMIPMLMEVFTQGKYVAKFEADNTDGEDEAWKKTQYANWVFMRQNNGAKILYDMFKDGLLQYTGWVKVSWDEVDDIKFTKYKGLSEAELKKIELDDNAQILSTEEVDVLVGEDSYTVYDAEVNWHNKTGRVDVSTMPPDEGLINSDARDFDKPRYIAQRTPKRRSDLIQMGFDKSIVDGLPADIETMTPERTARMSGINATGGNKSNHRPNDLIYLTESYIEIDVDEDGVTEYWQAYTAGGELLEKDRVADHPFAVFVPIPISHRAIGTCPAEKAADMQFITSTLQRQALNNIYFTNFARYFVNDRVDMDAMLNPTAGGAVAVDGVDPVQNSASPIVVQPLVAEIMAMKAAVDDQREVRTGVSKMDMGVDPGMLNVTATQFQGVKNASQLKKETIARLASEGPVKRIFDLIIDNATRYQDDRTQIKVTGETMEIDPSKWKHKIGCRIDVGIGAGDRQERIIGLNAILNIQNQMKVEGSPLVDDVKRYNTLERLVTEVGLKDIAPYFNDVEQPNEVLQAQVEKLRQMVGAMQEQLQNPLAQAEAVKGQGEFNKEAMRQQFDMAKQQAKIDQENVQFAANKAVELTELELKYGENVPGSKV